MTEHLPQIEVSPATNLIRKRAYDMMTVKEKGIIVTLLRDIGAKTVIETGVHDGSCAELVLLNVPTIERYVGIDIEPWKIVGNPYEQAAVCSHPGRMVMQDKRFELITRKNGSLDLAYFDLPECDAFIIDGDHGREAVLNDTSLARHRVRPGGIILWHDYYIKGPTPLDVTATLDEMAGNIKHIAGTWLALEVVA